VNHLTDEQAMKLVARCDHGWRHNGVATKLARSGWVCQMVPVDLLEVVYADPELHDVFRQLGHKLVAIAKDPRVLTHRAYAGKPIGNPVDVRLLLGEKNGDGRFRIFDGVHRAVQLVRNGEPFMEVCAATGS